MNEEQDVGYQPATTTFRVCVMVDHSEPMLFSAIRQIAEHHQFSTLSNEAKARCARHLAEMLSVKD